MSYKVIAKMCDTTVSTVSKAFHNSPEISNETKEKIYNAAKTLGLYDKYFVGKSEKKLIGIICPEPESETYGMLVGNIENFLRENGAEALIGIFRFDDERKAAMVSNLMVVLCSDKDTQPIVNSGSIY
jgi:DNA-binding LacI/PurR family transcriptional regulator